MTFHLIEGEAGCRFAVEHGCAAVIVDALRASATAAMLLHHGAREVLAVREVEDARRAKLALPDALLFGERGGLPPEGFDYGNSPLEAPAARGKSVIFTTTTGAGRLVSAWGARAVYLGTTVNATAVTRAAQSHGVDVVLVPAGLSGVDDFNAQEDWVAAVALAAVALATAANAAVGEGRELFKHWRARIEEEGLPALFASAPHAEKLRGIDHEADIAYCAQLDITTAVPRGVERNEFGVVVLDEINQKATRRTKT